MSVYFYIPNLIGMVYQRRVLTICSGYTRVILAIVGFVRCFHDPVGFFICYALSQLLDAVDGHAARFFNQTSEYGAVLDMVTDRCEFSVHDILISGVLQALCCVSLASFIQNMCCCGCS